MKFQKIKGTKDIFGEEYEKLWIFYEKAKRLLENFGYSFIITPTFEDVNLFIHSTGETTDIVEKEMYVFEDKGGRKVALRPEGTPSVLRAIVENRIEIPCKIAYFLNMFRHEKPQKGRFREFYQLGVENIGYIDPLVDLEMFLIIEELMKIFEVKDYYFEINSMGCISDRKIYKEKLKEYLIPKLQILCEDCKRRMERNPLRILDCKIDSEKIKDFPKLIDFLCNECKNHFEKLKEYLNKNNIHFEINPKLVRGIDYYTKTVFEIKSYKLGAQDALGGGGRYDGLMEIIGGENVPACGFALGIERVMITSDFKLEKEKKPIFIVYTNEELKEKAFSLYIELIKNNFKCEMVFDKKSLKSQMRKANKRNSDYVIIVGEEEFKLNSYKIKDMRKGKEEIVKKGNIINYLQNLKVNS